MSKKLFYCYSKRLAGFLMLHNQDIKKVIRDDEGKYIFVFWDELGVCEQLKNKYTKLKYLL